jgi:LPS O-antigen subunit length determinant protein (WzzB/FepE family)
LQPDAFRADVNAAALQFRGTHSLDFVAALDCLRLRKWWLIGSAVVFAAAFTGAAFYMTPVYRAAAVLVPASMDHGSGLGALKSALGDLGSLASLAGVEGGAVADSSVEEALAVLSSRRFTEGFISDEHILPELFANKWDSATDTWKTAKPPTLARGFKYFDKQVRTIIRDHKTGLVTLQIDWKNRTEAARWANELVRRLNAEMRSRAIANADAYVQYLEKEYQQTTLIPTRDAISRLIESQIRQRMLATVTQDFAFRPASEALPPDEDDPVSPKKLLLLAGGPFVGLFVGAFVVLLHAVVRGPPEKLLRKF